MSTNARVAAVVAKLQGKTSLSESFSSHTTATERTTNKNCIDDQNIGQHQSSSSRGDGTEEGDPSSEESVALSSYVAMPCQKDRQMAMSNNRNEPITKPPLADRSKSAKQNGKSARSKPSFFRSTSAGAAENKNGPPPSISMGIPTGESINDKDNNVTNDSRKKGFWARTQPSRNSKATQLVLGGVSSPASDSALSNAVTAPTESLVSPDASSPTNNGFLSGQQIKLFEQYEESESDIQSICTFDDDRSYFTIAKNTKGSSQLTNQERNSLGGHRPPVTNRNNAYIPSLYKKN
jgi:hypothetical protein